MGYRLLGNPLHPGPWKEPSRQVDGSAGGKKSHDHVQVPREGEGPLHEEPGSGPHFEDCILEGEEIGPAFVPPEEDLRKAAAAGGEDAEVPGAPAMGSQVPDIEMPLLFHGKGRIVPVREEDIDGPLCKEPCQVPLLQVFVDQHRPGPRHFGAQEEEELVLRVIPPKSRHLPLRPLGCKEIGPPPGLPQGLAVGKAAFIVPVKEAASRFPAVPGQVFIEFHCTASGIKGKAREIFFSPFPFHSSESTRLIRMASATAPAAGMAATPRWPPSVSRIFMR